MASEQRGARTAAIRNYLAKHPSAGPKEIVDNLRQDGFDVSTSLVSAIKYGKMSKKAGKGLESNGPTKISGSEAIRRFLAENPDAGPKVIKEQLARKGIDVSAGLISFVKFNVKRNNYASLRAPRVQSAARRTASTQISFEQLVQVKQVADALGGVDHLRRALDMLSQLA
ncbi:MAG: hypothetical protein JSS02_11935 [Planctomycetes bacterium]|nr:hypothetical protein [Planctomycetota bacterium]